MYHIYVCDDCYPIIKAEEGGLTLGTLLDIPTAFSMDEVAEIVSSLASFDTFTVIRTHGGVDGLVIDT
jgi:hypothetical protein